MSEIIVTIDSELEALIPTYLKNQKSNIEKMKSALDAEDYDAIRILGHNLKGSGGGYGFDELTKIGDLIEQSASENNKEKLKAGIGDFETYLSNLKVNYG